MGVMTWEEARDFAKEYYINNSQNWIDVANPIKQAKDFYPALASRALSGDKAAIQELVITYRQLGIDTFYLTDIGRLGSVGFFMTAIFWAGKP